MISALEIKDVFIQKNKYKVFSYVSSNSRPKTDMTEQVSQWDK